MKLLSNQYLDFYNKTIKEYKCSKCNKYFSNKSNMIKHFKNVKKMIICY